jgi:exoribonuclease II
VRMSTRPGPHAGMGVAQYAWATSPLRRYVDLLNQWQLIACVRHGRTAALGAPFRAGDVQLLAIVADFDAAYAEYNAFQSAIERYWSLQFLQQRKIVALDATAMKEGLVRADTLPLVFRAVGAETLPRGARVRVRVGAIDLLTLDLAATVVARLDEGAVAPAPASDVGEEDEVAAGPLAIAVDIAEGDGGADASPVAEPAAAA